MNPLLLLLSMIGAVGLSRLGQQESSQSVGLEKDDRDADEEAPLSKPPEVVNPDPEGQVQSGGGTDDDGGSAVNPDGGALSVMTGRVTTIDLGDDVAGVRILQGPGHGELTVNPDNTLALVLSLTDYTGADVIRYEVTHADGSTSIEEVSLDVIPGAQEDGFALAKNTYMLAEDSDGRIIIETGEHHVKVFVSESSAALSLADIAAKEGLSVSQITGDWLAAKESYGFSEGLALDTEAAKTLWHTVTDGNSQTSNHLLFERGYEYHFEDLVTNNTSGESELHPLYFGAWGDGDLPVMTAKPYDWGLGVKNVVFQDLHFQEDVKVFFAENWLFDQAVFTEKGFVNFGVGSTGLTLNDTSHFDIHHTFTDNNGDGKWDEIPTAAIYTGDATGMLIEGTFLDQVGWELDYNLDFTADGGQPPSWFSHSIYASQWSTDINIRDIISIRSAHDPLLIRSSGYLEDIFTADNNMVMRTEGGDYNGLGAVRTYTFVNNFVGTEAAYLWGTSTGAQSWGITDEAELSTFIDTLIVHLADPNDYEAWAATGNTQPAFHSDNPYYSDVIVYNWEGAGLYGAEPDVGVEGLDTDILDQTTIQNFIGQLLGEGATIDDFANYLRLNGLLGLDGVDADQILDFFQTGFGNSDGIERDTAETLRFIPDDRGDGVRWDNRINWSTEDLPGTAAGDSVELGGNHVLFGTTTTEIDELGMKDATLEIFGGKLTAAGGIAAGGDAMLSIERAGQIWTEGTGGGLGIEMTGGRLVNTGLARDVDLAVSDGQAVLASDGAAWVVEDGHRLDIFGAAARVGFDGEAGGMAILQGEDGGVFAFTAGDDGLGTIEEFRTGAMGDAPDVLSGIDLGGATLEIDLAGLNAAAGQSFLLMDADEITGLLDVAAGDIGGLSGLNANIVIDYVTDTVRLELTSGNGAVSVSTLGDEGQFDAGEDALWQALTDGHGLADDLPEEEDYLPEVA